MSHLPSPTFAECFCAKYNVPREKYARAVFNRVLYRRTHLFKWLLLYLQPQFFAADFDLIYGVENMRRMKEFSAEVDRFNEHMANHGSLRRVFGFRVSTTRLRMLMRETLPRRESVSSGERASVEAGSQSPFGTSGSARQTEAPSRRGRFHQASTQYSS